MKVTPVKMVILESKVWLILNRKGRQKVPILNDMANMTPILNGNLSIHSIRLDLKKDPFPSNLCSHIPSKMDPSCPPGMLWYWMLESGE